MALEALAQHDGAAWMLRSGLSHFLSGILGMHRCDKYAPGPHQAGSEQQEFHSMSPIDGLDAGKAYPARPCRRLATQ
jgi:hypothetical protein